MISNLNNINNIHFTSRNKVIRQADDIVRLVKKEYPMLSNTCFEGLKNYEKNPENFENALDRLSFNIAKLRLLSENMMCDENPLIIRIKNIIYLISNLKNGNCRKNAIPSTIETKTNYEKNTKKFKNTLKHLILNITQLSQLVKCVMDEENTSIIKLKNITHLMSKLKSGNCSENAVLAAIAAKTNGLKNFAFVSLYNDTLNQEIDHVVILVKNNPSYIIDAWLGFADYVPNAIQKYKNEFYNHFEIDENNEISLKSFSNEQECLLKECSNTILNKYYNHLVLPNNKKKYTH